MIIANIILMAIVFAAVVGGLTWTIITSTPARAPRGIPQSLTDAR
jgi:hypothetical protein